MLQHIREIIFSILKHFAKPNESDIFLDINKIKIEKIKNRAHGDISTNVIMIFSRLLGMQQNSTAQKVLSDAVCIALRKNEYIENVSVVEPGFVNMKLHDQFWQSTINNILVQKEDFSKSKLYSNKSVNLEFVSANPTGPLHTGHARNAIIGSVTANLLRKIGCNVTTEFYINDKGNQINALARSLYLRYREALGAIISKEDFKEGMYCGEYLIEIAQDLANMYKDAFLNKAESEWLEFFSKFVVQKMLANIKTDLALIGVSIEQYSSEKEICDRQLASEAYAVLEEKEDIYEGFIPKPKGIVSDDWEDRPQALFRATKYGDDMDRPLKKSNDSWTYFAGDVAYHYDKINRGFTRMIAIFGADHAGYIKRLQAAVTALSNGEAHIEVVLYQFVNFFENGLPVKMSKRAGNFITLREMVEKVGKDIARYMMISRRHDVMIDFDFVKVIECSMDNPIFYIQYAYARISSVFRNYESTCGSLDKEELKQCSKIYLTDEAEILLMRTLCFWPEYITAAANAIEPHRIPIFLQEIAHNFHFLWNKGKVNSSLRFIDVNNKEITFSRLSLLEATRIVLEDGMNILGITPMTELK